MRTTHSTLIAVVFAACLGSPSHLYSQDGVDRAISAVASVGREGAGFENAIPAAKRLRKLPVSDVGRLLDGFVDVNPVAENWLRGIVFDVVRSAKKTPVEELARYAMDQAHNPKGRGLAMELIRSADAAQAENLIAKCLEDPSLPLREMAVQQSIDRAKKVVKDNEDSAKTIYREALTAARHPRQLETIISSLGELGDEVKTADVFSMVTEWKSVAPFDNAEGVGFEASYGPEEQFASKGRVSLDSNYAGKQGKIAWKPANSVDDSGSIDLAAIYNKEKGAVGYLYAEFRSDAERPAEARLGCINANKVWINGELLMANEVYHSGSMIDQYTAGFTLKKGINRILLKVCQNEQSEDWAQRWEFQFRITDTTGKGLHSAP